jgi:membrane protease YdiL (CAAX protease family)
MAQLLTGTAPALALPYVGAILLPPLGEEPGWRGFLTDHLRARRGPLVAAIIVSALWALWHLPTAFYPGATLAGFPTYALSVFCAGLVIAWLVEHTRSLPVAVAAHAGLNGVFVLRPDDAAARVVYLALLAVDAVAAVAAVRQLASAGRR